MTRKQEAAERRRAAGREAVREGRRRVPRQPDLVVVCGPCRATGVDDGQDRRGFVERFRWMTGPGPMPGSPAWHPGTDWENRWTASGPTREEPLGADRQSTADPLGWRGVVSWLDTPEGKAWVPIGGPMPESKLRDRDVQVSSVWPLRCPGCGTGTPVPDAVLQATAQRMVSERRADDGRPPRELPPVTLEELREEVQRYSGRPRL